MTIALRPDVTTAPADTATAARPAAPRPDPALQRVAREFESMLVRQMLETANMVPGGSTERGMCLDAFAQGVADRGGLGLAQQLEAALRNRR